MAGSAKPGAYDAYVETGSQQHTADIIAAQNRARQEQGSAVQRWAPWVVGGVVLGGIAWFVLRD